MKSDKRIEAAIKSFLENYAAGNLTPRHSRSYYKINVNIFDVWRP